MHKMGVEQFKVIGINHQTAPANIRGLFSVNEQQHLSILHKSDKDLFVLSTCNRTEVYGFFEHSADMISLLLSETKADRATFYLHGFCYNGFEAISHLFKVASGIDSQLLGDYEITGQLKKAVKFAREAKGISGLLDKIINSAIQTSRTVRGETKISSGTVSLSYAAAKYIVNNVTDAANKKYVLVGTGKIGKHTCMHLMQQLGTKNITLINRTASKATEIADALQLQTDTWNNLAQQVNDADVVIVATNAPDKVITSGMCQVNKPRVFIDLSVPANIDDNVKNMEGSVLLDVDLLSKIQDDSLKARKEDLPLALCIIDAQLEEFRRWYSIHKYNEVLRQLENKIALEGLQQIHNMFAVEPAQKKLLHENSESISERIKNAFAFRVNDHAHADNYLALLNNIIETHPSFSLN